MNKERALHIMVTAMVREILADDGENHESVTAFPKCAQCDPRKYPLCLMKGECQQRDVPPPEDPNPHPQFDFDESTCEHGGLVIDRSVCPIHGPGATGPAPSAEELDDMTGETFDEGNPLIARARRKKALEERRAAQQGLYAEDIPMSGLAGAPPDDPPLVV